MYRTTLATSLLAGALLAGNAVPAQAGGLAGSALPAGRGAVAKAADYPVVDALAEIATVTSTSQSAALTDGFTAVMSFPLGGTQAFTQTTTVDRAGSQHLVASGDEIGGSFDSLSVVGVGNWIGLKSGLFGSVFGRAALKLALKYLGESDAKYVFLPDPQTQEADAESTGFASPLIDLSVKTVATADKAPFGDSDGLRYTLVTKAQRDEPAATATIDVLGGRIVAEGVSADGVLMSSTWVYGAEDLVAPPEAETVGIDKLTPALEAATLPTTLKSQAHRIIKKVKASAKKKHRKVTKARIRRYTAAVLKKDNGDGRDLLTHQKKLKHGARIFARNPYTHKIVAYKIVVIGGKVQLVRD